MRAGAAGRLVVLGALPLLVAAADPSGDVAGCTGGSAAGAPDLVRAEGRIVELGTSARWELTFAEPLVVPDGLGRPFRVDIAIHDPGVPGLSFAYFRGVNRLVRVDATVEHLTEIYLLPERGTNEFLPAVVEERTMTIQVPGRILSADEDLTGTSPGLDALRWTVVVRDGGACDFLGDGEPTERLVRAPEVERHPAPRPPAIPWIAAGGVALVGLAALGVYRARRAR